MLFTQSLVMLARAALAAASPLSARDAGNAGGACAYAERKTDYVYPDLCVTIRDNPHLQHYWSAAEAAGTSKAVIGVGLGALSLLFASIASSNLSNNVDCVSTSIFSQEDCDEKPVMPFMALGGAAMLADLIFLCTPNQKLGQARLATRDFYRDQYRDMREKAAVEPGPPAPSRSPDPVPPPLEQIEPADAVDGPSPSPSGDGSVPRQVR